MLSCCCSTVHVSQWEWQISWLSVSWDSSLFWQLLCCTFGSWHRCYKSWLRSLMLSPSITVLCTCQWRPVGFYETQFLHHWEGLQNFFLLSADFLELSLFPSDLICHCVPSIFLSIVVTFSSICANLLFLLSQCCFCSPYEVNFMTSRESKHRSFISHQ
jgi:hypothetical protein